jgi:hypothetical protein
MNKISKNYYVRNRKNKTATKEKQLIQNVLENNKRFFMENGNY